MLRVVPREWRAAVQYEVETGCRFIRLGQDVGWVIGHILVKSEWMPDWLFRFLWKRA